MPYSLIKKRKQLASRKEKKRKEKKNTQVVGLPNSPVVTDRKLSHYVWTEKW
jgi:hypothetical protein